MMTGVGVLRQVFRRQTVPRTRPSSTTTFIGDAHWRCLDAIVGNILDGTSLVVVTGKSGSGKSRILNAALARLAREPIRFVRLASTRLHAFSEACFANRLSLAEILDRFAAGLVSETPNAAWRGIKASDRVWLVVDDAETLGPEALHFMLELLDVAAGRDSGLNIIFVGRPEFWSMYEQCAVEGIRRRTVAHLPLSPLSDDGARQYAEHLLERAGASLQHVMSNTSLRMLVRLAHGNPQRLNTLVAISLEFATGTGKKVTTQIMMQAASFLDSDGSLSDSGQLPSLGGRNRFRPVLPRPASAPLVEPSDAVSNMPLAVVPGAAVVTPQHDTVRDLSVSTKRHRPRTRCALASRVAATVVLASIGPLSRGPPVTEMPTITAGYAARARGAADARSVPLLRPAVTGPVVLASAHAISAAPATTSHVVSAAPQADATDGLPAATTPAPPMTASTAPASQADATGGVPSATTPGPPTTASAAPGTQADAASVPPASTTPGPPTIASMPHAGAAASRETGRPPRGASAAATGNPVSHPVPSQATQSGASSTTGTGAGGPASAAAVPAQPTPTTAIAIDAATAGRDSPPPPSAKVARPAPSSTPPAAATPTPVPQPAVAPPSTLIASLIRHGDEMLGIGDIAAARLLFRRAADAGSAAAALAIGKTNDPSFLAEIGAQGIVPDPVAAAEWYRRAAALGDHDADRLLNGLGASAAR